ncbi:MAG TPA: phosphocholine cytidylyltransferase family protein [Polyangiaceae bacterium]|nr:phosphocholine cytidylyltransferase family protein [Polyangiaceae bacterium]
MKAIVIGAGRGSRLGPLTEEIPKTLVPVLGRPMLDQILDALAAAGFTRDRVVFVCGYRAEVVRQRYPELTFVHNAGWESNNILCSLLCAREHLGEGFVSTYADIVYEPGIVQKLVAAPEDLVLGCDTQYRRRYAGRTQHPESDAEKMTAAGRRITRLSRHIPSEEACGEFIGVMKASPVGARSFMHAFDEAQRRFAGRTFREGRSFERAYLIDLLQDMLEQGVAMHREDTPGGYMEIDTEQDVAFANEWWNAWQATASNP